MFSQSGRRDVSSFLINIESQICCLGKVKKKVSTPCPNGMNTLFCFIFLSSLSTLKSFCVIAAGVESFTLFFDNTQMKTFTVGQMCSNIQFPDDYFFFFFFSIFDDKETIQTNEKRHPGSVSASQTLLFG